MPPALSIALAVLAVLAASAAVFVVMQRGVVRRFRSDVAAHPAPRGAGIPVVTEAFIAALPPAAATWVRRTGAVGRTLLTGTASSATIEARPAERARWSAMKMEAVSHYWPRFSTWQLVQTRLGPLPMAHRIAVTTSNGELELSASPGVTLLGRDVIVQSLIVNNLVAAWTDSPASLAVLPITWEQLSENTLASTLTIGDVAARAEASFNASGDLSELTILMPDPRVPQGIPSRLVGTRYAEIDGRRILDITEIHQFREGSWFLAQRSEVTSLRLLPD